MPEQEPPTPRYRLSNMQAARIDYARRELDSSRAAELHDLPVDGLILQLELIRGRLVDLLGVVDEISEPSKPHTPE